MKKALELLLVYLITLVVGIVATTLLYSFYLNVLNYIAGNKVTFFSSQDLFQSLIFSAFCVVIIICPLVSYYRIRRPSGIAQTIGYVIVVLITWFLLFPGVCHFSKYVDRNITIESEETHLSKGYFRKVDKKVYYFTKDFESENHNVATSQAVVIDTNANGKVEYKLVRDLSSMDFNKKALPFKEILLKQNFDNSRITLPIDFGVLIQRLSKALQLDFYYIWYFLSFILVIVSLYALTNFFNWKLLNTVLIFFVTVSFIAANSSDNLPVFGYLSKILSGTAPFKFLSQYIYESFLFVFNTFFALVFITVGIVKFAIHNHSKKN